MDAFFVVVRGKCTQSLSFSLLPTRVPAMEPWAFYTRIKKCALFRFLPSFLLQIPTGNTAKRKKVHMRAFYLSLPIKTHPDISFHKSLFTLACVHKPFLLILSRGCYFFYVLCVQICLVSFGLIPVTQNIMKNPCICEYKIRVRSH